MCAHVWEEEWMVAAQGTQEDEPVHKKKSGIPDFGIWHLDLKGDNSWKKSAPLGKQEQRSGPQWEEEA